jgi:hypothetical protein
MDIPRNAISLRSRCVFLYRFWWFAHYSIGVLGILCAALLTALTPVGSPVEGEALLSLSNIRPNAWLLGVVATISGSLVTLLGPLQKAEKYWAAFHVLDQAIMELRVELLDLGEFARRVCRARKILQVGELESEPSPSANKPMQPTPESGAAGG